MKTLVNLFFGPLGVVALFLLGILVNVVFDIPGEGLWRLLPLLPCLVLLGLAMSGKFDRK